MSACACGVENPQHAVLTGPIRRENGLTLLDETVYDVNGDHVHPASAEHSEELSHLIGLHYHHKGHPHHDADKPFVYDVPEHLKGYKPHRANNLKGL